MRAIVAENMQIDESLNPMMVYLSDRLLRLQIYRYADT
jgi:hypothetical protein